MIHIAIDQLILETTRRCNMQCPHCLRGDAEHMDLSAGLMEELLKYTDAISIVTFSGGEPSLAVDKIQAFYRLADEYCCTPGAFYIATNGKENQRQLFDAVVSAYQASSEPEWCGISVSLDEYHEPIGKNLFEILKIYTKDKDMRGKSPDWPIRTGKADDNGIGKYQDFKLDPEFHAEIQTQDNGTWIYIETLYLSCNGNLYGNCDLSYDKMDNMPFEDDKDNFLPLKDASGIPWPERFYKKFIKQTEDEV